MRRFAGRGLVVAGGEAHYDSDERWVALLEQPRPRYRTTGLLRLPRPGAPGVEAAFDGKEPGCVWHRLFLDACIPPGTKVRLESRAADRLDELETESWSEEPRPYRRRGGSELPWVRGRAPLDAAAAGTWELLFQRARGRYLQLRVALDGNGRATPRLFALRVWYPRFSYLREYLPAVWREDPASASFLDRYLGNAEGTLTEIEGRIAGAQVLFDQRTAPAELLEWLAGWLGASLDAAWSEEKRRFFLANAMRVYAGRGTAQGIVRALRLALEECPDPALFEPAAAASPRFTVRVVERFLARAAPGVTYGAAGTLAPAAVPAGGAWSPAFGPGPLHERWREWVAARFGDLEALNDAWDTDYASWSALTLSPTAPAGEAAAEWRAFLREGLEFTYEPPEPADLALWRTFLAGRYAEPADLNGAWRRHGTVRVTSFESVSFPAELPPAGAELVDWITFVSVVLPMRRGAHRFTVLVPVRLEDPPDVQRTRRALAARLAAIEKPAHTIVDTRLYWAAFQVGSARLGTDSVLGVGSRFSTLVLGRQELGEGTLGWTEPWNVRGRRVVGRDPVAVRAQPDRPSARCS
ncbi:MAG TPA: phage tail protein, partial [Longimicrobiales bacterium]|nr:phage tail protein [Longimicrobiales bacterium]